MQLIGLEAIDRRPNTRKLPGHKVYPYFPGGWRSTGVNQVWAHRHHPTYPRGSGFPLRVDDHGLARPLRAGLAAVQHPGGRLLCSALEEALSGSATDGFNTDRWAASSPARPSPAWLAQGVQSGQGRHGPVHRQRQRGTVCDSRQVRRGAPGDHTKMGRGYESEDWRLMAGLPTTQAAARGHQAGWSWWSPGQVIQAVSSRKAPYGTVFGGALPSATVPRPLHDQTCLFGSPGAP